MKIQMLGEAGGGRTDLVEEDEEFSSKNPSKVGKRCCPWFYRHISSFTCRQWTAR
jgi:hypothetical protein